jgi:hypothetical protein
VLKTVYVTDVDAAAQSTGKIDTPIVTRIVLGVLALGVVLLGCAPDTLLSALLKVIQASGL